MTRPRIDKPTTGIKSLTPAEFKVFKLIAKGMDNTEIANTLFVGKDAVSTHLRNIYQKFCLEGSKGSKRFRLIVIAVKAFGDE